MSGLHRRLAHTLGVDGKTLIVAYDHGLWGANSAGMAAPSETLPSLLSAGADSVLTSLGIARRFERILSRHGVIISLDEISGDEEDMVREVVLLGAEMAKVLCFPWNPARPDSVARARRLATICHSWELPLMIETIPVSSSAIETHTAEKIGQAAKIGCEIGADIIKMQYTGSTESFRSVSKPLYIPIVILGGARSDEDRSLLESVSGALEAGATGVAIGRNIWMHENPAKMVAALAAVIHGGASPEQAMRELRSLV